MCNQRLSVNWEYQKAAVAAIVDSSYPEYITDLKKMLIERRDTLVKVTSKLPLSFPVPNGAFYAFIKIETRNGGRISDSCALHLRKGLSLSLVQGLEGRRTECISGPRFCLRLT